MISNNSPAVLCPVCETQVLLDKEISCSSCGMDFTSKEGFFDLIPEIEFYWGEIPRDLMQTVVKAGHEKGREYALTILKDARANTYDFVTRRNRADWVHLIPDLPTGFTAVDLGSGWGSIALPLSKLAGNVISIEATRERAEWQQLCKKEFNITNLHVVRGNVLGTKLPSNSVDLIVANGLVEWIGLMNEGPVDNIFSDFLDEMLRMLKPGGYFYCGIENRYMIDSFFGIKDHSGYRFTNLMPRWMAERYCKIRKPAKYLTEEEMSGYRTYTYSYWSWKNFLKNSGFSNISVYGLLPTYNNIEIQSRLDRSSIYRFCINTFVGERSIKRRILGALGRFGCYFGLQKLLHPFFGILARKPAANSAPQYDTRPDLVRSKPLSNKIISFYFDNSDVPTRVKKSVRYPNQAHLLKQEITGLEKANKIVGNNFDFTIPKILELKNSNQSLSFEQSAIAGNPLSKALDKARPHEDILYRFGPITEGFSILEKMASIQLHDEEHAHSQANVIAESFSRVVTPDNDLTSKFHQLLVNEINKTDWKKIACVPQHGDFSPSNILIDDKSISAIIDWEHFSETGLPLMDSLFFALTCTGFTRSINIGNNPTVEMVGNRYSHSFNLCFLKNSNLRRAISRHVKTICNITGMDLQSTRVLLPLFLADIATRFSIEEKNIIDPRYTGCIKLFMNADQASFFKDD